MAVTNTIPVLSFSTQKAWHNWLYKNHTSEKGLWLRFYKKDSDMKSINHAEALDEALCYGWIDGQAKPYDEKSWLQKFTPRRERSIWSKRNIEHIERLNKAGRMQPSGIKEVEKAKADGRWKKAYDSPSAMNAPDDFLKRLSKNKKAEKFFNSLNKTNRYSINWRLQTAKKPETREKRMMQILKMLENGETFH
jgi:uncharacterized protein YdeI (YjbR/CyaY-like superfamily)